MATTTKATELAVNGGPKAIAGFEGHGPPKIGVEEFMELADLWGVSEEGRRKIHQVMSQEDLGGGPMLCRYYTPREPSKVTQLERLAGELLGSPYVLAVNSGTSALNTAYVAAGIGPGDEVIVPGYTFFASIAEVVMSKAIPVIAEIDESLTIDPADVARKITPRTKAIVPVHMGGTCADMGPIMELAKQRNLLVIEDVAQACGASYRGKRLGTIGDLGCFSVSSYKVTGGGEAGLVTTKDRYLDLRARSHHDTGACWRPDRYAKEREPGELFCGVNYRLSELEGSVNLAQFRKMPDQVKRWNNVKQSILKHLEPFQGITPQAVRDHDGELGYSLVFFAPDIAQAQTIGKALREEGVPAGARGDVRQARDWHVYTFWEHILEQKSADSKGCPWTCPYYTQNGPLPEYSEDMCPRTLDLLSRAVFVSTNQWWTPKDCANIAAATNKVLGAYCEPADGPAWLRK